MLQGKEILSMERQLLVSAQEFSLDRTCMNIYSDDHFFFGHMNFYFKLPAHVRVGSNLNVQDQTRLIKTVFPV